MGYHCIFSLSDPATSLKAGLFMQIHEQKIVKNPNHGAGLHADTGITLFQRGIIFASSGKTRFTAIF